ncbi:MAG: serine/threonine-protein phosphatase [Oscillospiraceae bacterium]|jgi:serine/threonine protein phosphatase PrpC|nr:serine/threonine-protein phosphatase [Oscillospiraceae bacterium]
MEFYISSATDVGNKRAVNQDSYFAGRFVIRGEPAAFAVLCDGLGGLEHGEIASKSISSAFSDWVREMSGGAPEKIFQDHEIRRQWTRLIEEQNARLRRYGQQNQCVLGSTVTAILLNRSRYYILNIGDTRAYEMKEQVRQLTEDHTVIAEEVRRGNLSAEQARSAPMRNVLTRCVGIDAQVYGDFFFGDVLPGAVYMLCSDGFRHSIAEEEMRMQLIPPSGVTEESLEKANRFLIECNKQRGETDNISVVTIYVKNEK